MKTIRQKNHQRRKGITVSLGKIGSESLGKSASLQQISQRNNSHWHLFPSQVTESRPAPVVRHSFAPTIIPNNSRPPVIIYRYEKSEWEKLQQTNKFKRQQIYQMKKQLETLHRQVNNFEKDHSYSNNRRPNSLKSQKVNKIEQNMDKKFEQLEIQKVSDFGKLCMNPNKQFKFEDKSQYKIQVIQPVQYNQSKRQVLQDIKNTDNTKQGDDENEHKQKKQVKNRFKKPAIDLNYLSQIENRLNKLIDFTNF